jgi:hypothetical protein
MNQEGKLKSKTITGKTADEMDKNVNEWLGTNKVDIRTTNTFTANVHKPKGGEETLFCKSFMFWGDAVETQNETSEE